jgi:Holliday junction resolvase RusA-like endonuclease
MSFAPITLTIPGEPCGQPRPRASVVQGRASVYQPKRARGTDGIVRDLPITVWRRRVEEVGRSSRPASPLAGPLSVHVQCFFSRPQRLLGKKHPDGPIPHTDRPDRDNLDKPILDVLAWNKERGWGFWPVDAHVCQGPVEKWYCRRGGSPGAIVRISPAVPAPGGLFDIVPPATPAEMLEREEGDSLLGELFDLVENPANRRELTLHNALLEFMRIRGFGSEQGFQRRLARQGAAT